MPRRRRESRYRLDCAATEFGLDVADSECSADADDVDADDVDADGFHADEVDAGNERLPQRE